jgi:hypothetical protein
MRLSVLVLCAALAVSVVSNIAMARLLQKRTAAHHSLTGAAYALANQLLFDALDAKRIDIYTMSAAPGDTWKIGEYTIRTIPLAVCGERACAGMALFVSHNHGTVSALAGHLWYHDRAVSRALFLLMSQSPHGTGSFVGMVRRNGEDSDEVRDTIASMSNHFDYLRRRYGASDRNMPGVTRIEPSPDEAVNDGIPSRPGQNW